MWTSALASVALLLGCLFSTTVACSNYEIIVKKMEVCKGAPSIITFQNLNFTLSEDCRIIPTGCISHKAFTTAMVKYNIMKFPLPAGLHGDFDACEELKTFTEDAGAVLQSMRALTRCPATESQICASRNTIMNISPYKEFLPQATGRIYGELNIKHNTGSSCLKFDFSIEKKGENKGIFKNVFKKNKNKNRK